MLEHSVHAADARPLVGRLVRQGERIVRLADVEQVERGLFVGERHLRQHRAHVVVLRHQLEGVEAVIEQRPRIEDRQRHHRMRPVSEVFLQKHGEIELRDERLELERVDAEAGVVMDEVALIVLRGEHVLRTGVRHQPHQQVVVRRRGPGRIRPALLDVPESVHHLRPRADERVEAAAVEDHEDEIVPAPRARHDT